MRLVAIISSCIVFLSCSEGIQLDLEQTPPKIAIEGIVTDKPGLQSVKVTRSTDFYASGQTPRITDATVIVEDDLGGVFTFVHNPNGHVDSAGIYVPQNDFVGVIGRTYTLRVTFGGDLYEATDKLARVLSADSLSYKVNEFQKEEPEVEGRIYEVLMFAKEPQDEVNFYLFKFYRNDSLTYFNETDIYFSDDEFLRENIDGVSTPIYYSVDDLARIEIYSLSRKGYLFYNDLSSLLNNDAGGMFGPIPASPRTNLTNGAIGFFQVSAVTSSEIKVE